MTLLASWAGVDTHGISSVYITSESRFSYSSTIKFDFGKKVFASNCFPDIFGYVGDVLFPTTVLSQILEMIDSGVFFDELMSCDEKNRMVYEKLNYSIKKYPKSVCGNGIEILHISRETIVKGYPEFYAYRMKWNKTAGWTWKKILMPKESNILCVLGSGSLEFLENYKKYQNSKNKNTSRNVFHCFCDTLSGIKDDSCGGAPQLVGCFRKPMTCAMNIGIIYDKRRFFMGAEVPQHVNYRNILWRNENFEIVDGNTKKRKESAAIQTNGLKHK